MYCLFCSYLKFLYIVWHTIERQIVNISVKIVDKFITPKRYKRNELNTYEKMNVGSILNNDSPPSDNESAAPKRPEIISQQRHSLVNLLNDPAPEPKAAAAEAAATSSLPVDDEYKVPKQVTTSPYRSPLMKRNSIANITNDRDVNIATGESTLNISRKSSMSESNEEKKDEERAGKPQKVEERKEEEAEEGKT